MNVILTWYSIQSKVLLDREFEFLQRSMASQKLEITTSDSPSVDPGVKTKKTSVTDESGDKKKVVVSCTNIIFFV